MRKRKRKKKLKPGNERRKANNEIEGRKLEPTKKTNTCYCGRGKSMCVFIDSCRRQITEWRERERGAHALHASTNPGEGKPDMVFAHSNILLFLNTKKIKRTDFTNGTGAVEEKKK